MKIHRDNQPRTIKPKQSGYTYKCVCGNRLVSYETQNCEVCKAKIDWSEAVDEVFDYGKKKKRK